LAGAKLGGFSMTKIKTSVKNLNEFNDLIIEPNPIDQFIIWYTEAIKIEVVQPDAMILSTSGISGHPAARVVLLKEVNRKGFVLYTNYLSFKAKEIALNPFVSLTFHWKEMERQVRILGKAGKVSGKESDAYFRTRSFESQVSAIISEQSSVVQDRLYLENNVREFIKRNKSKMLKRPEYWGGYRIKPFQFEFWQAGEHRLHDRIQYRLEKRNWITERLAP
jgi:pyridoxamine 5'-phosphate oxidase